MSFDIGYALDVGRKRGDRPNQDAIGFVKQGIFNPRPLLLIVADGMGGYAGGAVASDIVVNAIKKCYKRSKKNDWAVVLRNCILFAHQSIRQKTKKEPQLEKMGSTVAAVILEEEKLFIGNIGDSRVYVVNNQEINQVSYDHSVVAKLVRQGAISELEARNHPKRNRLLMSISARREEVTPYIVSGKLGENDIVVLCSDGLWGAVSDDLIKAIVTELSPQKAADKLVEMANVNQGPDNISVIVARKESYDTTKIEGSDLDDTNPGF